MGSRRGLVRTLNFGGQLLKWLKLPVGMHEGAGQDTVLVSGSWGGYGFPGPLCAGLRGGLGSGCCSGVPDEGDSAPGSSTSEHHWSRSILNTIPRLQVT